MNEFKITKVGEKGKPRVMKILDGFGPFACLKCDAKNGLNSSFFFVNKNIKTIEDEEIIRNIMKKRFNIESYGVFYTGRKTILTVAQCQKCGSHEIFWDY